MIEISRKYHFYAAHRVFGFGEKCERIHGHTYNVTVCVGFLDINKTMPFHLIDSIIEPIIKRFCHHLLLKFDDPLCKVLTEAKEKYIALDFSPTCENLAFYFYKKIKDTGLNVVYLDISETLSGYVRYKE